MEADVDKLKEELEDEIAKNKTLEQSIAEEEELLNKLSKQLAAVEQGAPDGMWYQKYKNQHDENAKLEENIKSLEEKLLELQGHFREVEGQEVPHKSHDLMSGNDLRQYIKRLERKKVELQGELKDCEWRLDQESIAFHRTLEEKEATSTELSEVLASVSDGKVKKSNKSNKNSPEVATKSKSKIKK